MECYLGRSQMLNSKANCPLANSNGLLGLKNLTVRAINGTKILTMKKLTANMCQIRNGLKGYTVTCLLEFFTSYQQI